MHTHHTYIPHVIHVCTRHRPHPTHIYLTPHSHTTLHPSHSPCTHTPQISHTTHLTTCHNTHTPNTHAHTPHTPCIMCNYSVNTLDDTHIHPPHIYMYHTSIPHITYIHTSCACPTLCIHAYHAHILLTTSHTCTFHTYVYILCLSPN